MKFVIWGLGAVGASFLRKIIENGLFNPSTFYCIDTEKSKIDLFCKYGGLSSHFCCAHITKENHLEHLKKLEKGDYLFDFTTDIKSLDILKYCLKNHIHYLNTADCSWNPDPDWISDHQHFLEYSKFKDVCVNSKNTSIYLFGMNPGLVSCFAKKCLKDIVNLDSSFFVKHHRKQLLKLIENKQYGLLCKKLGVTDIQEVDNDNQLINHSFDENTICSTWNPSGFFYETVSSPEIAFGTKKRFLKYKKIYDVDFENLYLALFDPAYMYKETTFSPQGFVKGHLSTHEELFTLRDYLSFKKYSPTVHFVYSPCDVAMKSIESFNNTSDIQYQLIKKDEILCGGESVGVIIQGKRFKTRYFGNYLDNLDTDEVATIVQVSTSAYAAFKYMLNHPKDGLLFPEDLDEDEICFYAKPYLKEYLSVELRKIKMNLGK